MGTQIDYEKTNKYLPQSLREFVGATNRMMRQNFNQFIYMYEGLEQMAVYNNRLAAEFASGFNDLNYQNLRSGACSRLLDIVVSKAVGKVWYQTAKEKEKDFNTKVNANYISGCLKKAFTEAGMTARSLMVLYGNENDIEIVSYNLFRHKLIYGKGNKIEEAFIYIVSINTAEQGIENVICEHRFYKKVDGVIKPCQRFDVYAVDYRKVDREDAKTNVIEKDKISDQIKQQYKDIDFGVDKVLDLPNIGVYDIKYTEYNKKFLDVKIPEAMFVDAIDNAVELETSITDKEVEKEVGRGQILLPEFESQTEYIDQVSAGVRVMRSITRTYKNPVIQTYPSRSMEDSKPMNVQFDIRSSEWASQIDGDTARLCASVGVSVLDYDPRLLQTGQRTDDEINAMTDITANTVTNFRNINEEKINAMLTDIATYYKLDTKVAIRWSMASILNPTKNTQLVISQLNAGLISRKAAIQRANPDLNDQEVQDLYDEIMVERGAEAVENRFNNF